MGSDHRLSIWCPRLPPGELRSRLAIAEGVASAEGPSFEAGALVPRGPWREATDDELAQITRSNGVPAFHSCIGIVTCPQALVARARGIFLGREAGDIAPADARRMRDALGRDLAAWIDEASDWRVDGEIIDVSLFHNAPGKLTVSFDPDSGLHVGMHLDSFDRLPDHLRSQASNRFSINLGTQGRYLLFVDLEAVGLLSGLAHVRERLPAPERLATRYLVAHPDTPIWRLRLDPGEAYFAPTENIIHDGSSLTMSSRDIHCTLRGHFLPGAARREPIEETLAIRRRGADGTLRCTDLGPARAGTCGKALALPDGAGSSWLRSGTAEHITHPYGLIKVEGAIEPRLAGTLYGWLAGLDGWRRHADPFYAVDELDLSALTPPAGLLPLLSAQALADLREKLGRLFHCRFGPRMRIVGHRVGEGQGAGIHSDDPGGVEETHRMVVTLGQDESTRRGGLFAVFDRPSPDGLVHAWAPLHNRGFLFEAHARSYHAITEVRHGRRYSVLLSFWREAAGGDRA